MGIIQEDNEDLFEDRGLGRKLFFHGGDTQM